VKPVGCSTVRPWAGEADVSDQMNCEWLASRAFCFFMPRGSPSGARTEPLGSPARHELETAAASEITSQSLEETTTSIGYDKRLKQSDRLRVHQIVLNARTAATKALSLIHLLRGKQLGGRCRTKANRPRAVMLPASTRNCRFTTRARRWAPYQHLHYIGHVADVFHAGTTMSRDIDQDLATDRHIRARPAPSAPVRAPTSSVALPALTFPDLAGLKGTPTPLPISPCHSGTA